MKLLVSRLYSLNEIQRRLLVSSGNRICQRHFSSNLPPSQGPIPKLLDTNSIIMVYQADKSFDFQAATISCLTTGTTSCFMVALSESPSQKWLEAGVAAFCFVGLAGTTYFSKRVVAKISLMGDDMVIIQKYSIFGKETKPKYHFLKDLQFVKRTGGEIICSSRVDGENFIFEDNEIIRAMFLPKPESDQNVKESTEKE